MPTEMLTKTRSKPQTVTRFAKRELDVRGRTITTAIAWAVHEPMEVMQQADVQLYA